MIPDLKMDTHGKNNLIDRNQLLKGSKACLTLKYIS